MANSLEEKQAERLCFTTEISDVNGYLCESDSLSTKKYSSVDQARKKERQASGATSTDKSPKSLRKIEFDKLLIEAINEALTTLGEPVKNTFYQHLEDAFNIKKKDIPKKLNEFASISRKIFGWGASHLEIKIVKNLNSKIKAQTEFKSEYIIYEWISFQISFEEYINKVRESYENLK